MDLVSIGLRVKEFRTSQNLTQDELGSKLGVSRDAINNIERGRLKKLPEAIIKLICLKFNVDYDWIMTGQGEMFHKSSDKLQDTINNLLEDENPAARAVFTAFAKFSEDDWKLVQKFIDALKNGAE